MAFNYNQALQNMLPLFGSLANGAAMTNHPNFMNQLAAPSSGTTGTPTAPNSNAANVTRDKTPEPPPAPKLNSYTPPKVKPNQGTAPMDLENESESDLPVSEAVPTNNSSTAAAGKQPDRMHLNMHDPNMFLNGLMAAGINPATTGYMFYPSTATGTAAAATNAAPMLMDPTAMMAAAMQQIQQGYGGYGLPDANLNPSQLSTGNEAYPMPVSAVKEIVKTKNCILFPPNPNAPPPTIRERPLGCRTIFVGGLPENITEEIIREIFESCGEITTLRMSKKNFCHIRYRTESSIDRAIYLSGYRLRIPNTSDTASFGRLHVDYAQARDDQYDYECKQRQLQREQRHRERQSADRSRSESPPATPHYSEHEASLVAESLRNNETFVKGVQTITTWLERGDCTKRNANVFYSMVQSTHAHVRRLHGDKQTLEEDLRKARESYRKQMQTMSTQFTQIEKVFSAASHKKVWDHFTKAQRKNIDQWKKLASELRSVQIEDDEMEISDDDRDYRTSGSKKARYDSESLKDENDSLRCQLEAIRNEMSMERTDIKYSSDFREKQIKVLQETIRNMQTQIMQTKVREQRDALTIEQMERKLKEAGVKQLLLKTKIRETEGRLRDRESSADTIDILPDGDSGVPVKNGVNGKRLLLPKLQESLPIIAIDVDKGDDDVRIIEDQTDIVVIAENEDETEPKTCTTNVSEDQDDQVPCILVETALCEDSSKVPESSLALLEAKIIALTTAFLVVQPLGVSTQSICNYLANLIQGTQLEAYSLEDVLRKYSNLFENVVSQVKSTEVKWKFCGFLKPADEAVLK